MRSPDYFLGSVHEALSYRANALMIFSGPPQSTKRTAIANLKIAAAQDVWTKAGCALKNVVVHAPYIINLASVDETKRQFGIDFIVSEVNRTAAFGAPTLVLHPGSSIGSDPDSACIRLADSINAVFRQTTAPVTICLETMAGKGNEIGTSFVQLKSIITRVKDQTRIGVCMDTCHMHDAGYDLTNLDGLFADFATAVGLNYLRVVHLNDSKNPRGAHRDRHANIDQGEIGLQTLAAFCARKELKQIPIILETPYVDDAPVYAEEIALLNKTVKHLH